MKEYILHYNIIEEESFTVDLEKLADIIIKDFKKELKSLSIDYILQLYNDNLGYYLDKLGFNDYNIEIDYDKFYNDTRDNLKQIIKNKIENA